MVHTPKLTPSSPESGHCLESLDRALCFCTEESFCNSVSSSKRPKSFIATCPGTDFSFSAFHIFKDRRQLLLNADGIHRHLVAALKKKLPPELAIFSEVSPFSFFGITKHTFLWLISISKASSETRQEIQKAFNL